MAFVNCLLNCMICCVTMTKVTYLIEWAIWLKLKILIRANTQGKNTSAESLLLCTTYVITVAARTKELLLSKRYRVVCVVVVMMMNYCWYIINSSLSHTHPNRCITFSTEDADTHHLTSENCRNSYLLMEIFLQFFFQLPFIRMHRQTNIMVSWEWQLRMNICRCTPKTY